MINRQFFLIIQLFQCLFLYILKLYYIEHGSIIDLRSTYHLTDTQISVPNSINNFTKDKFSFCEALIIA